jgi:hypothetical protein
MKYPFVGYRAKISRAHLSHAVCGLLFLIWHMYTTLQQVDKSALRLKHEIMEGCESLQKMMNQAIVLPFNIIEAANVNIVKAIDRESEKMFGVLATAVRLIGETMVWMFKAVRLVFIIQCYSITIRCAGST